MNLPPQSLLAPPLEEVCGWVNAKAMVPVWAKMTLNITDITQPARVSLRLGCEGVAAINTIMSVMGINLKTLHPEPCVEGYSTPGGYSSKDVHPIALAKVMSIAQMMKNEFPNQDLSRFGIGGVETGGDAAEFILLGANIVQSDRLHKVLEFMSTVHDLCAVVGLDFYTTVTEVHLSLNDATGVQSKSISNDTLC